MAYKKKETPTYNSLGMVLIDEKERQIIIDAMPKGGWAADDLTAVILWCNEVRTSNILLDGVMQGKLKIVAIKNGAPLFDTVRTLEEIQKDIDAIT